jgi:hypothetical protein
LALFLGGQLIMITGWKEHETHNNHMHSDSKKRRSFLAMLFAAGDVRRYKSKGLLNENM